MRESHPVGWLPVFLLLQCSVVSIEVLKTDLSLVPQEKHLRLSAETNIVSDPSISGQGGKALGTVRKLVSFPAIRPAIAPTCLSNAPRLQSLSGRTPEM